jgi:flavin reductase (DIM6/NTAB) family NADH-FMN oxidoreductase RutF
MDIDPESLDRTAAYKLLIGSVVPRPIAWVSTQTSDGVANLAPISFFTVVGRKPMKFSLTLQPKSDGTVKDTYTNIRETGEFVVHIATFPQIDALHRSAVEFEPDEDEFDAIGLVKEASTVVRPPRIKDAPIAYECVVDRIFPSPDVSGGIVWGKAVSIHIRDDLYLERGRVDTGALQSVGRLAAEYTLVGNAFVPPLSDEVVARHVGRRMERIDGHASEYSAVDQATWSPSGSVLEPAPTEPSQEMP